MPFPEDLFPHSPNEGPPLPKYGPKWPWLQKPNLVEKKSGNPSPIVPEEEAPSAIPASDDDIGGGDDDFVLVLRKKPVNPVWLKKYQERFAEASSKAAELTKDLSGEEKLRARRELVSRMLKDG